jgi:signal peptidase II
MTDAAAGGGQGGAPRRRVALEAAIIVGIVALDQLTKYFVRAEIPIHGSIPVVPGVFNLVHVRNTGAAFGFLNAVDFPYKAAVVALIATAALIGIALYAARMSSHDRLARIGLALILGGAVGNLIDRLALGSVVDFADVVIAGWHFWAFNVADSAITIGVVAMLADMIGLDRHVSRTV